ncbi:hypothetical protein JYU34_021757 [Plutella xylostella]|uniref:Ankyrin repeat protein n=1 Tax=Plutella xylostella TaxID=51655 RepID=A0ABQ7PRC5_PLUXY|nr:hypothetical protein JYU34_021757 [Plutella xylostella]
MSPSGIAAQEGHEECVMWLLQYGADPLQADHCGRTPAKVAWRAGHANICRLLERFTAPSAPAEDTPVAASRASNGISLSLSVCVSVCHANICRLLERFTAPSAPAEDTPVAASRGSPDYKRRSVHSSNSTKSSSNLTATSTRSHHDDTDEKASRAHLSLSFAQQVARCGRRERDRDNAIPEHRAVEQDANLRSYLANEKDFELRNTSERDRRRDQRHLCDRESTSPLYASPPHSPLCSPVVHDNGSQPASLTPHPAVTDQHFNRDTHMRIILGRDSKPPPDKSEGAGRSRYTRLVSTLGRARGRIFKKTKGKRNGIVTNPAMRLVNNVKNGLDSAAANIRRTGVALAASAGSNNPAVKSNAFQFQWRRETPL